MPPRWESNAYSPFDAPGDPFTSGGARRTAPNGNRRTGAEFRPQAKQHQVEAERATRTALMDCYNG